MLVYLIALLVCKLIPCIKGTVFFDSFHGQYSDNPKYISEQLYRLDPTINIAWCISEKGKDLPPKYVKCFKYGSLLYYYYAFNSVAVVDNNVGIKTLGFKNFKLGCLKHAIKKSKQLCVSTWHGTPIKHVGKDQIRRDSSIYYTATDYMISGSDYNTKVLSSAFFLPRNSFKQYGMPRTDIFFTQYNIKVLKEKLGIPQEKSVVLFAPTFRESVEDSGIIQLQQLDLSFLLKALTRKFNKEFVFVYRVHHTVANAIRTNGQLVNGIQLIDGNQHDDMAEYLAVTDVLITDYSGSMFDFAITSRPCFLYAHDLQSYKRDRGLYIDYESLPFPKSTTPDELYEAINAFSQESYVKKVKEFNNSIGNCEDGNASLRVCQDILTHLGLKQ